MHFCYKSKYSAVLIQYKKFYSFRGEIKSFYVKRGAWAIFPGAQPTEQPRRVPRFGG